jgi:hypothetical protein
MDDKTISVYWVGKEVKHLKLISQVHPCKAMRFKAIKYLNTTAVYSLNASLRG